MRIALTCDDAPSIRAQPPRVRRDPSRMDRIRSVLQRHGVRQCVAFVIGAEVDDQGALLRWRDAGYELGNHTHEHAAASQVGAAAFLSSVRRCDELLQRVGAWANGGAKWFRFPYLDYGASPSERARIAEGLAGQGYRIAHATADLHDDRFEDALGGALTRGSGPRAALVDARYRHTAHRALREAARRLGEGTPQVPYFHFGAVSERSLERLLRRWSAAGVSFESLEDALGHPALARDEGTGLLLGSHRPTLLTRATRRAQRVLNRLDPSRGRWLGPPCPRVR